MTDATRTLLSILCNAVIVLATAAGVLAMFRNEGRWDAAKGRAGFRYFTVLSNVFCALAALAVLIAQAAGGLPFGVWITKYIATVAVSVTMVTVLVFLGPNMGYKPLLSGWDLFMHLLTPLLAIVSFSLFERQTMAFPLCLLGLLPTALYGAVYCYRVVFLPEGQGWEDFYGFNKGGHWRLSIVAMLLGTFLLCLALWATQLR